eukprot:scaffold67890_cov18-Tisochrysis_lutea.AAC.1
MFSVASAHGNLTQAATLCCRSLANNFLQGTIPASWASCTRLDTVEVQGNAELCGDVPPKLKAGCGAQVSMPISLWELQSPAPCMIHTAALLDIAGLLHAAASNAALLHDAPLLDTVALLLYAALSHAAALFHTSALCILHDCASL